MCPFSRIDLDGGLMVNGLSVDGLRRTV